MKKLFELSVRGSLYYCMSAISENQLSQLRQFASQFYRSNPACTCQTDDEIKEYFAMAVKRKFDIEIENVPVAAVLVIK